MVGDIPTCDCMAAFKVERGGMASSGVLLSTSVDKGITEWAVYNNHLESNTVSFGGE